MKVPAALERVIGALARLPGVGEKTAGRYAFHILAESESYAAELANAIGELHASVHHCERCHNLAERPLCGICREAGSARDVSRVCVTEGIQDLLAVERTGEYRGTYHVLHGALSPLKGVGPDSLTIASLLRRVTAESIIEVILATNVDVEGEATALYLQRLLSGTHPNLTITRIATGVPMGGELEYMDQVTLARALRERRSF